MMNIINILALREIKTKSINSREKVMLFLLLDEWLFRAEEQIKRFEHDEGLLKKAMLSKKHGGWIYPQKTLFMDMHFYIIAMAHISKILESLKGGGVEDIDFNLIYKKNRADLQRLRKFFRNLLEHVIENPLKGMDKKGKKLKNPGDFGNISGNTFTLFGEKIDIKKTFALTKKLISDLKKWSDTRAKRFYSPHMWPRR